MLYDAIGAGYVARRATDPRIAAAIRDALGEARTVLNVGAGTGSYEPSDRDVVAVEPSPVMCAQRTSGRAPVVRAVAEQLPFRAAAFDAVLAVLTVHHWTDQVAGLRECRRVCGRRVVLLTWDPRASGFWLVEDYFPDLLAHDRRIFPSLELLRATLGGARVETMRIPGDCVDGFLGAYWRRPEAYLDDAVRGGMSSFSRLPDVAPGLARLRHELDAGIWDAKYGTLRAEQSRDLGYRLVIADA